MKQGLSNVDHDVLMEVHSAIYGVNGQGGLTREMQKIELGLFGNPDAISDEDKLGMSGTLRLHIREHEASQKRLWAAMSTLVVAASAFSHYILDLFFKS